ncbi:GH36-type glycosyl hydrolase domain-containing protein [Planctobacterium marinum]|uniref:GH36-type glycosyl hydrolase domain-containing protein n=1 Tax=Planctobacterium marinum TaxID=1631968 RepID=UPI001E63494A|nr:amylo-alpha-1,6-glucosidase [Planctobacterium marinum]MCC2606713.1 hypothetical protein [Planctobacterium marinum]
MNHSKSAPFEFDQHTGAIHLYNPDDIPNASGYLWNKKMLLNMTCRGFASCHFMQPEPATYSCGPALEAKTFLQPEHYYYQGHPGRFFYVRDHQTQELFSLPFEPMSKPLQQFRFTLENDAICWHIRHLDWCFDIRVSLSCDDVVEIWQLKISNRSDTSRSLSIYPCFNIGYQSWMNQGANYSPVSNSIIGTKITPYQKLPDYYRQKDYLELSFFSADQQPDSYAANLAQFLGSDGWSHPAALNNRSLGDTQAVYETPVAVMHFDKHIKAQDSQQLGFIFGAARDEAQIQRLRARYLTAQQQDDTRFQYRQYLNAHSACIQAHTPDAELNQIINHWLPRQVYYHGDVNRLTTDPQTRNYLQDAMGMCYLAPDYYKQALLRSLAQQASSGAMPDGILLHDKASLKYINQVPHADPCVWLPITLQAYLDETDDFAVLNDTVPFADTEQKATVLQHIDLAMKWLQAQLDERGLSLIEQGDWCDPMNMVGHQGKGVSSWLSMASSWAFQIWANLLMRVNQTETSNYWQEQALTINNNVNQHFWHQQWYGRGITDAGRLFGTENDQQGKIYLNPQSWAMLCQCASPEQEQQMLAAVQSHLSTPFGVAMLAPAYTAMVEDIGRLTQKFPGVAENGSLYNHAAAFFVYALYQQGHSKTGYATLQQILCRSDQALQKQQLPNFVPNYYRGASPQHPEYCGLSSRLFNTGTIAWIMRTITEQIFGLKGTENGLLVQPQLPPEWPEARVLRTFRGHKLQVRYRRNPDLSQQTLVLNDTPVQGNIIATEQLTADNDLLVLLPTETDQ